MSVNWDWKMKKGCLVVQREIDGKKKNFKVNIYQANCLGALTYEYKDKETKKDMYNFWGFWNDITHLRKCLGIIKNYDGFKENLYEVENIKKVMLNTYYKDSLQIGEAFAKVGYKVELYYKEPKK